VLDHRDAIGSQIQSVFRVDGGYMNISEIMGKGVFDKEANAVGKVADVEIDVSSWKINNFIVKSGLVKKLTIGVDKIDKIGDKVFLQVTKEEIGK
jgi:sporulation protein YlmC with PRC-barrel domain